ncbi:MAG: ABC transporter substrate-binding protein, partial [Lentisphaeria bacterium]|nr:ABC transporter substrate-binding protein [Lentisphaeria bacterium]
GRVYQVGLFYPDAHPIFETAGQGVVEALREAGFVEGENLTVRRVHASNDLSLLPQLALDLGNAKLDVLVPLSTPCLGAALAQVKGTPLVFGVVSAPLEAGAGTSFTDHLPQVTGAVWSAPNPELFRWLQETFPAARRAGVVYNPAEANSRFQIEASRRLLAQRGMTLVERTVANSSEVMLATEALLGAGVDVVFGIGDSTVASAFPALVQACRRKGIPVVAGDSSLMGSGALFACGANPKGEGRQTGRLAARVLLGESPAALPFLPSTDVLIAVDLGAAAELGVVLPATLLRESQLFYSPTARRGRPFRLALVNLVSNPLLDAAEQGVLRGLTDAGFREGTDFTVARYNAQGEISQLPALFEAARTAEADLIVTLTTPALLAAAKSVRDIPVVFTVASDPVVLGLFTAATRPANLVGVHDDPPVDRLLDMACRHRPGLASVGTLYDPAQPNSLLSVEKLRKLCGDRGLKLHEATAATVADLPAAAQSLVQRRVGAILLSADNLVSTGFPTIRQTAADAGIPVFVTCTDLVRQGATGGVGDSYGAWGEQAGLLAARVLAGVSPGDLPLERTRVQEVFEPKGTAPAVPAPATAPSRPWQIRVVRYNDAQFSADTFRGMMDGLKQQGLQEGRDFQARCLNAQGDMTTLASIMVAVRADEPDLVMVISTPALQAALRQLGSLPIVFGCVADGVQAGAGVSDVDHLPNVTGISTRAPAEAMAALIRESVPGVRAVGTLFSPGEVNAELNRKWFAEALAKENLKLVAIPINGSAEAAEATSEMLRSDIQVVAQIMDNAARPAYGQIARRARDAGLPFLCFDSSGLRDGATLSFGRDYYSSGIEAAEVAVRVLRGTSPKDIPLAVTRTETLAINPELIRAFGIRLSPEQLARAQIVSGEKP